MPQNLATMAILKGIAMPEPFSLREIADELDLKPETVKYHIYKSGYFKGKGKLVGHTLSFTQEELDEMKKIMRTMPRPGRKSRLPTEIKRPRKTRKSA